MGKKAARNWDWPEDAVSITCFSLSRTEWNIPMAMYSLICINFFSYMVTADAL